MQPTLLFAALMLPGFHLMAFTILHTPHILQGKIQFPHISQWEKYPTLYTYIYFWVFLRLP